MSSDLSPCKQLAAIASTFAQMKKDALSAFAEVHLCICEGVDKEIESQQSLALRELSEAFTIRFIDVHQRYMNRGSEPPSIHLAWKIAFKLYEAGRENYPVVLASMAAAHIAVDLYRVLCDMEGELSLDEYNSVNRHIFECLEITAREYANRNVSDEALRNVYMLLVQPAGHLTVYGRTLVYLRAQQQRVEKAKAKLAGE